MTPLQNTLRNCKKPSLQPPKTLKNSQKPTKNTFKLSNNPQKTQKTIKIEKNLQKPSKSVKNLIDAC
jgi:hypothetical protein